MLRTKPAACVDDEVVGRSLADVDDEPLELPELLAARILDRIVFERHLGPVEVFYRHVLQIGIWMIHRVSLRRDVSKNHAWPTAHIALLATCFECCVVC